MCRCDTVPGGTTRLRRRCWRAAATRECPNAPRNWKEYFTAKYKIDDVISSLHQTPHGLAGTLHLLGPVVQTVTVQGATAEERARAAAKAFIAAEPSLFGIADLNEIREFQLLADELGMTHIYYRQYINDVPLDGMTIMIHVGRDESSDQSPSWQCRSRPS